LALEAILIIGQFQDGVEEKGEQVEGQQKTSQVLFAVAEVVLQVIALGFEDIVVFVFTLPAGLTGFDDLDHGLVREGMIGDKGIMIQLLPGFAVGDDNLTPIDIQSFVTPT
jgi:hypothetical protein